MIDKSDRERRPAPESEPRIDLLAEIFSAVADAPVAERDELLNEMCPDDDVRQLAIGLLAQDSLTDLFVDRSPFATKCIPECGESVGPYKLLQAIGEGGMGIVFMAEQTVPVRRKVALKLVKPGVDTQQVLARFDAERQALSVMDHPNIARVLDAGETESGRPYFVMELVKGRAINEYCRQNRLSTRERLELFIPVCQAIQHAHQKGIIHRDLKPTNVLVAEYDGRPVAKVIDFGIAKAIHQPLTDLTMFTGFGQLVGTFEYMSPEQSRFNQLDIDTRSDIYGLGVLLYELLTGTTPFDRERLRAVEWEEMLRIIREEDPPVPSTRLSETARTKAADSETQVLEPVKISRIVRGEVDWIVMKALDKDRERRYATAQALADDIRSFLHGDPVAACPPTLAYRLHKFAKRNRAALLTSSLVVASLVVGLLGTSWQAFRASNAESDARAQQEFAERQHAKAEVSAREARAAANRATAISRYLQNDLLGLEGGSTFLSSEVKFDPDLKLITLLERAQNRLESRFSNQPDDKSRMKALLIGSYCSIGKYDIAADLLRPLLDHLAVTKGPMHPSVIEGKKTLVTLELQQGNWLQTKPLLEDLLDLKRKVYGHEHHETGITLNNLATTHKMIGDYASAEILYQQYYDMCVRIRGPQSTDALNAKIQLAAVKGKLNQSSVAEHWLEQVVASFRNQRSFPESLDEALRELGEFYLSQKRFAEAEGPLAEALDLTRNRLEVDSAHTLAIQFDLATVHLSQGKVEQTEEIRRRFIEFVEQNPKLMSAGTVEQIERHAELLLLNREFSSAERLLRLACRILEFHGEAAAFRKGCVRSMLGESLATPGQLKEAEGELLAGYDLLNNAGDARCNRNRPAMELATRRLVDFYELAGDPDEAKKWRKKLQAFPER